MVKKLEVSAFDVAQRFLGIAEVAGSASNPHVLAMLRLDTAWPNDDDVPWCSAFANYVAWLLRLPRSKDLRARSWLKVGAAIDVAAAEPGFDVVVLQRGGGAQPGPEVMNAPGHVGFFAGAESGRVLVLGGNQANRVSVERFPVGRVLGIRRLV